MADKSDFSIIYAPETAETRAAALLRTEAIELNEALANGDFKQAGLVLREAGSCNWSKLIPDNDIVASGEGAFSARRYAVNLTFDRTSSSIELREKIFSSSMGMEPQYDFVPRLTVHDAACPTDKPHK
jgi:hypothetical protein